MKIILTRKQYAKHDRYVVFLSVVWADGRESAQTYARNGNPLTESDFVRWAIGDHLLNQTEGLSLPCGILAIDALDSGGIDAPAARR